MMTKYVIKLIMYIINHYMIKSYSVDVYSQVHLYRFEGYPPHEFSQIFDTPSLSSVDALLMLALKCFLVPSSPSWILSSFYAFY